MQTDYRECPQCGEPIEGRSNKKFCDETCKGRYFRENKSLSKSNATPTSQTSIRETSHLEDDELEGDWEEREIKQWLKQKDTDRRALAEQEQTRELHKQFCDLVQVFLESEGQALTARPVIPKGKWFSDFDRS